ncbi:MAG: metalloregulator ArsR/SmtB family transcription factor [Chloroflexi bacterium]|nr:metalloregulator ArsR/SmtB family transcription factor [Chloroflexota bacterium]
MFAAESSSIDPAGTCEVKGADLGRVRHGRATLVGDETYAALAETFAALADSTRAKIVHALMEQEMCTCDLAAVICVTESAVSQHLRILRMLHLVKTRREGRKVLYSLADSHVRFLFETTLRHLVDCDGCDEDGPELGRAVGT